MFDALHRLLTGLDHPHRAAEQNDSAFALAVLLIDVARSSDNRVEDREEGVIERALARRFGLDQGEVTRLVKAAEEGALQPTDLFHFTQSRGQGFTGCGILSAIRPPTGSPNDPRS